MKNCQCHNSPLPSSDGAADCFCVTYALFVHKVDKTTFCFSVCHSLSCLFPLTQSRNFTKCLCACCLELTFTTVSFTCSNVCWGCKVVIGVKSVKLKGRNRHFWHFMAELEKCGSPFQQRLSVLQWKHMKIWSSIFILCLNYTDLLGVHLMFTCSYCQLLNLTSPSKYFSCVCVRVTKYVHTHTHAHRYVSASTLLLFLKFWGLWQEVVQK